jgi:agmatine deiminase
MPDTTPDQYHMPAEWQPQEATWLSWPCNKASAPQTFEVLQEKFGEIAALISMHQKVRINAPESEHHAIRLHIMDHEGDLGMVEMFDHATNDVWCRDHGPIFVKHNTTGEVAVTDWGFNAWGGKFPPYDLDNQIPQKVADALKLKRFASDMILEGGAIETNGHGVLITTEAVLLNKNRNPGWSKKQIEDELKKFLGVKTVFWLGKGIEGDDTDGHVDDITRFVRKDCVLTAVEAHSGDANYKTLAENKEKLEDLRTEDGSKVEIIELPMPNALTPKKNWRLERLPASYANFVIANGLVLVPIFRQAKKDKLAQGIIGELFPGREVIGVECSKLVMEGGALHCISQQQPKASA